MYDISDITWVEQHINEMAKETLSFDSKLMLNEGICLYLMEKRIR